MFRMARTRSSSTLRSAVVTALLAASVTLVAQGAASPVVALSPDVVISQVYGGGGNSGATYTNDFVELFNRGTAPVSLTGWSVQYASSAGTTWQVTQLAGTVQPGQYYLVQEAAGAGGTTSLPTPDVTGSIAMSGSSGKVALVNSATALSGSCPSPIDLVGYGSANCFEGAAASPTLSNTTAAIRGGDGCTETDQNGSDFVAGAPTPRNTASPFNLCGGGSGGPADPIINEFSASTTGSPDVEWIEVLGDAGTDYSDFTVIEIEGDSSKGNIDRTFPVGTTDGSGLWTTSVGDLSIENGTVTLLLVEGFTGSVGNDIDADDDGAIDNSPWTRIVDDVAVFDGGAGDLTYASVVLGPNYDGVSTFAPGGASRIPNGTDTGTTGDWTRNDFDLFGISGFAGSPLVGEAENTPGATNVAISVATDPLGVCGDPATLISSIQGAGLVSSDVGSVREIEGVVVGDFQDNVGTNGDLNGFHLQEEDSDADADSATSEGIFVFQGSNPAVDVENGDVVRVRGSVAEFNGLTEINNVLTVTKCGTTGTASPTTVSLPVTSLDDFEKYEGMLVTFPQDLVISEYFNFDRFGEIVLTSERHLTPTAEFEPGPDAIQAAADFLLDKITLDDGRTNQNPDPAIHPNGAEFTLDNLFRGGDTVANVTGVMDYGFGLYRIQPTQGADYTNTNPRTAAPDEVGGNVKVSSFNVLNYFTTLDNSGPICGSDGNQDCRGADNAGEFTRQRDKIVAALAAIDADVFGLMEIENNDLDGINVDAVANLVDGLNAAVGADTYDSIDTGTIGTDAIKVAIIYKPAAVTPLGGYAVLDSSVDARFIDTKSRPALAQSFLVNSTGGVFTVAVNHLKSKSSDCDNLGDPDVGDGAGNCNLTRKAAAEALVDWAATDPTGSGDSDFLIIGDLNSYDKEDPIDAIIAGSDDALGTSDDYTDLVFQFVGEDAYSYVFNGQTGYLDSGLANASLAPQVTGTTIWHINADEPDLIDYDTSFKGPNQDAIYAPDPYRSSDHDPVIIGLDVCDEIAPTFDELSVTPDVLWSANHRYIDITATVTVSDNFDTNPTVTLVSVTSSEPDDAVGNGDGNTVDDIVIVDDSHFKLRAERAGSGPGRTYTITYEVTDACGNATTASVTVFVPRDNRH